MKTAKIGPDLRLAVFLHFLPFSFSQEFGYFVFRYSREHFRHFLEFIHSRLASAARLPCLYLETGCDCILGQYTCIPSIWYITASSKFGQCQPVMKNKPGVQGQLETEKYFECVIIFIVS